MKHPIDIGACPLFLFHSLVSCAPVKPARIVVLSVAFWCPPQLARKHRAGICGEAVDAVAPLRYDEGDIERWALLVINLLIVGDGAGAVGVELLRPRDRLRVRWPAANHYRAAAGKRTAVIGSHGAQ